MDAMCSRRKVRAEVRPRSATASLSAMLLCLCCAGVGWTPSAAASTEPAGSLPTLTTTHQAHSLRSSEAARHYPVRLRGVVTNFDPKIGKGVGLFVHDSTGSIFVDLPVGVFGSLPPGSVVDLRGVTDPGEFGPIVAEPQIKVIGFSGLPGDPRRPTMSSLLAGVEDGQWVEVEGIVHAVLEDEYHVTVELTMGDGVIGVFMLKEVGVDYSRLVDAKVSIRGNVGPLFDLGRHHMIGVRIQSPGLAAVETIEPAPDDPFKLPTIPVDKLLEWDAAPMLAHRVHVQGRVTLQWPGALVCLRDASLGICAHTDQSTPLRNGELIDVAGFASAEGSVPVLTDAIYKSVGSALDAPGTAPPVTPKQALNGNYASQLIEIEGKLISRDRSTADTTLLIASGNFIFTAILPQALGGRQAIAWEDGSGVRIVGICLVQLDPQKTGFGMGTAVPRTFRMLMRSPADVTVIQKPTWWTPKHAVLLLALGLTFTLCVLAWVVVLRRRVQQQANLLRESEGLFRHMALHDALTGLPTRVLLQDRLDIALEGARRHRTGLAVLTFDLDFFKTINDTFGHQAGDEVLRVAANRVLRIVRKADTVARLGGDEFVVLLPELNDPQALGRIAGNIVESLAVPFPFAGREIKVSASVGICASAAGEMDADALLRNADAALYNAKANGRNCFQYFTQQMAFSEKGAS